MNHDNIPYDLIDKYLEGILAPDHEFVKLLEVDSELAQEVEIQRLVHSSVIDNRLLKVKSEIEKYRPKPSASLSTKWIKWLIPTLFIGAVATYFALRPAKKEEVSLPTTSENIANTDVKKITNKVPEETNEAITISKKGTYTAPVEQPKQNEVKIVEDEKTSAVALVPSVITETPSVPKSSAMTEIAAPIIAHSPCAGIKNTALVTSEKPCTGSSNGSISFENPKGGMQPLSFSIDNGANWTNENPIKNLKAGVYYLLVKDANDCISLIDNEYHLANKTCIAILHSSFNPNIENWDIPVNSEKAGEIMIFDKMGQMVFKHLFQSAERTTWNGSTQNGQLVLPGTYVYTLKYNDGAIEQGNVTVSY